MQHSTEHFQQCSPLPKLPDVSHLPFNIKLSHTHSFFFKNWGVHNFLQGHVTLNTFFPIIFFELFCVILPLFVSSVGHCPVVSRRTQWLLTQPQPASGGNVSSHKAAANIKVAAFLLRCGLQADHKACESQIKECLMALSVWEVTLKVR